MKRPIRFFQALVAAAGLLAVSLPALAHARAMGVEIWTDRGDDAVYEPGKPMTLKVRVSDDSYLLVYEIDSEGNVRVLYPSRRGAGLVEGKRTLRIPAENSRYELAVGNKTGQGFLVAIASRDPFRELPWFLRPYDPQAEELGYDRENRDEEGFDKDGRVVGDPYVAMERIRRVVLGRANDEDQFTSSYTSYYVGHEVRYPRYICNDCHRPGRWNWAQGFDPYYSNCSVFDFRVNWGWTWGPQLWSAYVPYYYYVVRADCPPRYSGWYDDRSRWSSWDGWRQWNDLWGGNLTRYKPTGSAPGAGAPPRIRSNDPSYLPPGYLANRSGKRGGPGEPLPIGRNRPGSDEDRRPSDRGRGTERMPAKQWDAPRREPAGRPSTEEGDNRRGGRGDQRPAERPQPRYEPPTREPDSAPPPKQQPSNDPPRKERRDDPPPRQDPPRQDPPRQDPPRQDPPHREPQRQDPPRRDPPASQKGDRGGYHKGGGGEQ